MSTTQVTPTITLMKALQAALEAATLTGADPEEALFDRVAFFARENLVEALNDLLIHKDRVCLIVPTGDTMKTERTGSAVETIKSVEFVLLIADRARPHRQEAQTGGDRNPGCVLLDEEVCALVAGQSFHLPHVGIELGDGDPFRLTDQDQKKASGRECWARTISSRTGTYVRQIGRRLQ